MIKVIAADMDGTLLGSDHLVSKRTEEAVIKACEKGIRFMVVTGRNYISAIQALDCTNIVCDYIVSSGAQIRNSDRKIIRSINLSFDECEYLYKRISNYPIGMMFCSELENYMLGTYEEVDNGILDYIKYFHLTKDRNDLRNTSLYKMMWAKTKILSSFEEMKKNNVPISKMFLVSDHVNLLKEIEKELKNNKTLAVSSSFQYNLEVTDYKAQKGPILKEYIESLGYTMDEVMVLGDSLNDLSMMEMNFGATVSMANANDTIKKVASYQTKSNEEDGVAFVIEEMLKMYGLN